MGKVCVHGILVGKSVRPMYPCWEVCVQYILVGKVCRHCIFVGKSVCPIYPSGESVCQL